MTGRDAVKAGVGGEVLCNIRKRLRRFKAEPRGSGVGPVRAA